MTWTRVNTIAVVGNLGTAALFAFRFDAFGVAGILVALTAVFVFIASGDEL